LNFIFFDNYYPQNVAFKQLATTNSALKVHLTSLHFLYFPLAASPGETARAQDSRRMATQTTERKRFNMGSVLGD
jgi:hypothetical protein